MKLYSYVVARDFGFAPNPFYGICTLACCKPKIRGVSKIGDWVVGTGSKTKNIENRLVYAMQVTEILSFDAYWRDPRFLLKRPNFNGSLKRAYGDNIYHRGPASGEWIQENSHHTFENGEVNIDNLERDTGWTDRVLISTVFAYWGGSGPVIPREFDDPNGNQLRKLGAGHKSRGFAPEFIHLFQSWLLSLKTSGVAGPPAEWSLRPQNA